MLLAVMPTTKRPIHNPRARARRQPTPLPKAHVIEVTLLIATQPSSSHFFYMTLLTHLEGLHKVKPCGLESAFTERNPIM